VTINSRTVTFRNVTPFGVVKFWRSFGGMCSLNSVSCLHLTCQHYIPESPQTYAILHSITTQSIPKHTPDYTALQLTESPNIRHITQNYNSQNPQNYAILHSITTQRTPKHTPYYTALQLRESPNIRQTTQDYNSENPPKYAILHSITTQRINTQTYTTLHSITSQIAVLLMQLSFIVFHRLCTSGFKKLCPI
jgi:hypothetical protein